MVVPGSPDLNSETLVHARMVFCKSAQGRVKAKIAYYLLNSPRVANGGQNRGRCRNHDVKWINS
jgi:hypothetical protein